MKENLLLLHGALGTKAQFKDYIQKLNDHFTVHTFNFEGHGGIPSTNSFSIESFSKNLIEFLDKNKIEKANIFGYSMGGYVALYTSIRHPRRISKIITLGTKFNWNPETAEKEASMLDPNVIEIKVPHFANRLDSLHHPLDWKEVMHNTREMMMAMGNGERIKDDDFSNIDIPVIIGLGSLDRMVSTQESEKVKSLIPNSKFQILNDVSHPIEKNSPDVISSFILDHLE